MKRLGITAALAATGALALPATPTTWVSGSAGLRNDSAHERLCSLAVTLPGGARTTRGQALAPGASLEAITFTVRHGESVSLSALCQHPLYPAQKPRVTASLEAHPAPGIRHFTARYSELSGGAFDLFIIGG